MKCTPAGRVDVTSVYEWKLFWSEQKEELKMGHAKKLIVFYAVLFVSVLDIFFTQWFHMKGLSMHHKQKQKQFKWDIDDEILNQ